MNSWVWSASTEILAEAGKNNEQQELNAYDLGLFGLPYRFQRDLWTRHFCPRRGKPMIFVHEANAANVLVTLTLSL